MSKKLTGTEYSLKQIFSKNFEFSIPHYQRPYSWTGSETSTLFEDLIEFFEQKDGKEEESYFLGSIVLIKEDDNAAAEVVDGQQRLTTLTILLAAIASILIKEGRNDLGELMLNTYIREQGNPLENLDEKPRLTLRESDRVFFEKYVQKCNFEELLTINSNGPEIDSDSKRNIKQNSKILLAKLRKTFEGNLDELEKFSKFVVNECYLVTVWTPNEQSAFRVFSVLNDRGLNLMATDIIKADIMGTLKKNNELTYLNYCTEAWENIENQLGRDEFNELFGHIRMIRLKKKAKRTILEEFKEFILPDGPRELMDNTIIPFAESFKVIKNCNFKSEDNPRKINDLLKWLSRIDFSDWLPPSILFLSKQDNKTEDLQHFFRKMERLAAYLHICGKYINYRIERFADVIRSLESQGSTAQNNTGIELTDDEKSEMRKTLSGHIYGELTGKRRNYLLLRLDSFLSDGAAVYDNSVLSIEHVLPQNVSKNSAWDEWWPNQDDQEYWMHRIANLVLLTKQRNSSAQNYDFEKKKNVYFTDKRGVTSYTLTTQVLNMSTWTPEDVENRQQELLDVLYEKWELH